MKKELFFHILGIEETKQEGEIREAYRKKLKGTNPEDNPEGFKRLRQAYEEALAYAGEEEKGCSEGTEGEIDLWMKKADRLYHDLAECRNTELWERLLADPVCEGLDTSLEARERLLDFLMGNRYLPHKIWVLINDAFQIVKDFQSLAEKYPTNFLNAVKYYTENEDFLPYDLFRYRQEGSKVADKDAYIDVYLDIRQQADAGRAEEALHRLEELQVYNVYHPYEDVERAKVRKSLGQADEGRELTERLWQEYKGDAYIGTYAGELLWEIGEKEQAYKRWKTVLAQNPECYGAKYGAAGYLWESGEYSAVRDMVLDLLAMDPYNQELGRWLQEVNSALILEIQVKLEEGTTAGAGQDADWAGRKELNLKLGWCLLQNDRLKELEDFFGKIPAEWKDSFDFCGLYGRFLQSAGRYREALPYLKKWQEQAENNVQAEKNVRTESNVQAESTVRDGTEKRRGRMAGKADICLGECYAQLGQIQEAEEYLRRAILQVRDAAEKRAHLLFFAGIFLNKEAYGKAAEICDEILRESEVFYPAYLIRQEAEYKLGRAQAVVEDYRKAVAIYAGYYRPYLYAAEVFLDYGQYDDVMHILDAAKANQVKFTVKMKLCEIRLMRGKAQNHRDRQEIRKRLDGLQEELDGENCDLEDKSELVYEQALLWWDDGKLREALACMERAMEQNPQRLQYRMACGEICWEMRKYEKALREYEAAEAHFVNRADFYYRRGMHYGAAGDIKAAIRDLEKTLELQGEQWDVCERLADYYYRLYQKEYRKSDYARALQLISRHQPAGKGDAGTGSEAERDSQYFIRRGLMYMNALETEEAIRDFEKAEEFSPQNWAVRNYIGCCHKYNGEYERALEYFRQAIACAGRKKEMVLYGNMAECYEVLGKYKEAVAFYRKAGRVCRRNMLLSDITEDLNAMQGRLRFFMGKAGDLLCYMGDYVSAFGVYASYRIEVNAEKLWLAVGWKNLCIFGYKRKLFFAGKEEKAEWQKRLGLLYLREMAEYEKAIGCFEKAAALDKGSRGMLDYERYMAVAYYMLGRREEARRHGEAAFFYFSNSGQGTIADYLEYRPLAPKRLAVIGWMMLCVGREEEAAGYFRAMEEASHCRFCTHRECYKGRMCLGYWYESHGKLEEAEQEFREALLRNRHSLQCRQALRRCEKRLGRI